MSELLFLMIFGHFLADYLFQTSSVNKQKESKDIRERCFGLLKHIATHFLVYFSVTLLLGQNTFFTFGVILLICVFHLFIDFVKVVIKNIDFVKSSTWYSMWLYIFDQIFHIVSIIWLLNLSGLITYEWKDILLFLDSFLFNHSSVLFSFSTIDKIAVIGTVVMFNTYFCAYLLEILLKPIRPNKGSFVDSTVEKKSSVNYKDGKLTSEFLIETINKETNFEEPSLSVGKYIGMVERLLMMLLIAFQAFTAITFLVTIKALTRFKQFDDKCFAEYYLIGSLTSILLGIISGVLIMLTLK
ncbi:DUF3307 domain-containing protein [Bacillus thuringiensis]|uniref:DUF3307 domain-containing protein n=1 Tax=Bacillus thuringiensis TaxID=1428 RepID=UPI003672949A